MLELSLQEILEATNGKVIKEPLDFKIHSVSIDTRKIQNNSLFISIKGERFNGNTYVIEAFNKGARLCLVDEILFKVNT